MTIISNHEKEEIFILYLLYEFRILSDTRNCKSLSFLGEITSVRSIKVKGTSNHGLFVYLYRDLKFLLYQTKGTLLKYKNTIKTVQCSLKLTNRKRNS